VGTDDADSLLLRCALQGRGHIVAVPLQAAQLVKKVKVVVLYSVSTRNVSKALRYSTHCQGITQLHSLRFIRKLDKNYYDGLLRAEIGTWHCVGCFKMRNLIQSWFGGVVAEL